MDFLSRKPAQPGSNLFPLLPPYQRPPATPVASGHRCQTHPHSPLLSFTDSPHTALYSGVPHSYTTDHARPSTRALSSDSSFSPSILATKIQAAWRGFHWRQKFLRVKRSGVRMRGSLGGAGTRGGLGHHSEKIKDSYLWYLQPSVFSHGGVVHWAGGRQPRGSGQPRLSVGECWGANVWKPQIKVCMGLFC